jgi:hypothetical protein
MATAGLVLAEGVFQEVDERHDYVFVSGNVEDE